MFGALLLLIVAMISIQGGASLAKNLFPLVGPAGATTIRLVLAAIILWGIWRPWRLKLAKTDLKNLWIYGSALGLMNLTFYIALERIPLGLAVTLEFVGPLTLSVFTSRRKIDFLWVLMAATGLMLVMPVQDLNHALDPIGVAFALFAGFFWAGYIYFGQKAGKNIHGGVAASIGMAFAALITLPFGLYINGDRLFEVSLIPLGLSVAILSSALPYSLEMVGLKKIPTKTFGVLMSLESAVASIIGLIVLNETLTETQWMAIGLVVAASLGSSIKR